MGNNTSIIIFAATAVSSVSASAYITLYEDANFQGVTYGEWANDGQCVNVPSWFNDRASSATWSQADLGVRGYVGFFEHENCGGNKKWWSVDKQQPPKNFGLDDFNDVISSFIFARVSPSENARMNATTPSADPSVSVDMPTVESGAPAAATTAPSGENK